MNNWELVILFTIFLKCSCSPPHQRLANEEYDKILNKESDEDKRPTPSTISLEQLGIEYQRYLQQVIQTLESDHEFKKKLESANEADIRSGKIAEELEYVSHHVRSKLDELKRVELDRLRTLAKKKFELSKHVDRSSHSHVDINNPDTFEIKDLQRLIYKVAEDLQEADKKRKELFKEYEMQKHFERDQKLSNMSESDREQFLQHEKEEVIKKNSAKSKLHHPGSRKQLEEVWEEQDHLDKQDFNPKVFFATHDLDSNGYLDEDEVKTLFISELNKVYPNSDLVERDEEMERMREHVFNEIDLNKDRLISWDEFYAMSLRPEFNQDQGWQTLDEQQIYTQQELDEFERNRQAEVNKLVQEGKIPQYQAPSHHYSPEAVPHAQVNPHYDAARLQPPQYGKTLEQQKYAQQYPEHLVANNYLPDPVPQQGYQQYENPHQQQYANPNHQQFAQQKEQFAQQYNQQFVKPQQKKQQFVQSQESVHPQIPQQIPQSREQLHPQEVKPQKSPTSAQVNSGDRNQKNNDNIVNNDAPKSAAPFRAQSENQEKFASVNDIPLSGVKVQNRI